MQFNTSFMRDFTIAEQFGAAAVQDTYDRVFKQWSDDYRYLTDLVLVLNHKLWRHWELDPDSPFTALYNHLWETANDYALDNLKGPQLSYFIDQVG